jgi:hypothetical protein
VERSGVAGGELLKPRAPPSNRLDQRRITSRAVLYASLAVAPLMVVTPILQLSLVFRLFLSQLINRGYEVMNTAVLIGAFTAVFGSILVSLDTDVLMKLLDLPPSLTDFLRYRLAGG